MKQGILEQHFGEGQKAAQLEKYGRHKLQHENGAFTRQGYILYHGYNMELSKILAQIGIEIEPHEIQTLKLYMPLKATTYFEKNMYGYMEQVDDEIQIDSADLIDFRCEIMEAIKRNNLLEEAERG